MYNPPSPTPTLDRFRGCLLGGAIGDAFGMEIEFMDIDEIRARFGPDGQTSLDTDPALITDDTQMTLFTAHGMLATYAHGASKGISHLPSGIRASYARWLETQGVESRWSGGRTSTLLSAMPELNHRRSPGHACITALKLDVQGTWDKPINDSKGCGGVMRVTPIGMTDHVDVETVFANGRDSAALTHGHPTGNLAAGALAVVINRILRFDLPLKDALAVAIGELRDHPGHEETLAALESAMAAAHECHVRAIAGRRTEAREHHDTIAGLGEGWIAEEALAIAVYCALVSDTFEQGIRLAANHGGDSDSTAAIAGNLLGLMLGADSIPDGWLRKLELVPLITMLADDLAAVGGIDSGPVDFRLLAARYLGSDGDL